MRRAAKVDDNQNLIVDGLRRMGCTVQILSAVGHGCPDILVGVAGINLLMEIKDGSKVESATKLTPDQVKWHGEWRGQVHVVKSLDHAIRIINYVRTYGVAPIPEREQGHGQYSPLQRK